MTAPPVARRSKRGLGLPMTYVITMVPVCAALNIVGSYISHALRLPIFLDMIGTAVAAIVLGPWWGALVGILTNSGLALVNGPVSLPFALVNIVGALLWGYGVRSWRMGRTFPRYFLLNIIVALGCTLTAVPIYVLVYGGATGQAADAITATFLAMGQNLVVSVFSSNILASLADKIIGGFVALAIIEALPPALTSKLSLLKAQRMRTIVLLTVGLVVGIAVAVVAVFVK